MQVSEAQKTRELSIISCLDSINGLGPVKFKQIYEEYHSFSSFWDNVIAPESEYFREMPTHSNIGNKMIAEIRKISPQLSLFEEYIRQEQAKARELGSKLLTYLDTEYPLNLFNTNQCLPILYATGNVDILKENNCCAIVGTRNPSEWSKIQLERAVKKLLERNTVIVSGLAKGIDSIAHRTTLDQNGKTIAVLGCGIDVCYPRENRDLYTDIKGKGVIVSEYPFGVGISPISLQKRDKIIVGLSENILIVETSKKGGTMNAYKAAVEQKKTVGVMDPPSRVVGSFDGNAAIMQEKKTRVHCFSNGDEVCFNVNCK